MNVPTSLFTLVIGGALQLHFGGQVVLQEAEHIFVTQQCCKTVSLFRNLPKLFV